MAKRTCRPNGRELKKMRAYHIAKYGTKCGICGEEVELNEIVIDHKDNDPTNWNEENLQIAHQSCNIKKNPPYRGKTDVDNWREREGEGKLLSSNPNYKIDSYSIWKNLKSEPTFVKWLDVEMKKKLRMEVKQAINDGANVAECSPKTTEVYLNKLVYETGPYKITKNLNTGIRYLEWKERDFPFKDEIEKWTK